LEAPTEEREEAVQSGGAHYAESLPHEYQPDAAYLRLYHEGLPGAAGPPRGDRARVAAQGGPPGGRAPAPLGGGPPRAHAAALRRVDRPWSGHRRGRPAPPGRAPRPGPRRVRRGLDGAG